MQMNEVILERRRALGLTQEQVADALGVTAPAVNKWEKGATCPDIALLAPLARLLGIDLNELMCFHENLTEQEVHRFSLEIREIADRDGLDAAFAAAREKVRTYPNSDFLVHVLAVIMQALLALSPSDAAREEYQSQILQWHEHAAKSDDPRVRERASLMLASLRIQQKNWDAAERAIGALPERHATDKRVMEAQLRTAQDRPEDAAQLLERVLFDIASELSSTLLVLVDAEIAAGNLEVARKLAEATEVIVKHLDLWEYIAYPALLQVAIAEKDVRESVRSLRLLLETIGIPWKPFESPLYRRVATQGQSGTVNERLYAPILKDLQTNPNYEFLRDDPEFQELIDEFRPRAEQT